MEPLKTWKKNRPPGLGWGLVLCATSRISLHQVKQPSSTFSLPYLASPLHVGEDGTRSLFRCESPAKPLLGAGGLKVCHCFSAAACQKMVGTATAGHQIPLQTCHVATTPEVMSKVDGSMEIAGRWNLTCYRIRERLRLTNLMFWFDIICCTGAEVLVVLAASMKASRESVQLTSAYIPVNSPPAMT